MVFLWPTFRRSSSDALRTSKKCQIINKQTNKHKPREAFKCFHVSRSLTRWGLGVLHGGVSVFCWTDPCVLLDRLTAWAGPSGSVSARRWRCWKACSTPTSWGSSTPGSPLWGALNASSWWRSSWRPEPSKRETRTSTSPRSDPRSQFLSLPFGQLWCVVFIFLFYF